MPRCRRGCANQRVMGCVQVRMKMKIGARVLGYLYWAARPAEGSVPARPRCQIFVPERDRRQTRPARPSGGADFEGPLLVIGRALGLLHTAEDAEMLHDCGLVLPGGQCQERTRGLDMIAARRRTANKLQDTRITEEQSAGQEPDWCARTEQGSRQRG